MYFYSFIESAETETDLFCVFSFSRWRSYRKTVLHNGQGNRKNKISRKDAPNLLYLCVDSLG